MSRVLFTIFFFYHIIQSRFTRLHLCHLDALLIILFDLFSIIKCNVGVLVWYSWIVFWFGHVSWVIYSYRLVLICSVLAAKNLGEAAYDNFLDRTFIGDRKTTIRQYLASAGSGIMEEEPPESLKGRYGGWSWRLEALQYNRACLKNACWVLQSQLQLGNSFKNLELNVLGTLLMKDGGKHLKIESTLPNSPEEIVS